jgi:hypothetical protein
MTFSPALGCFRFCEFLDGILHAPGSELTIEKLAVHWRWPRSTISGHLNKRTSPTFDRVCESFFLMSDSQQDALLAGLALRVPEITLTREPLIASTTLSRQEPVTIALQMSQVDQDLMSLVCDSGLPLREKIDRVTAQNQLRRRIGEQLLARLQMDLIRQNPVSRFAS